MKKLLVILSVALLALYGLVVPGAILAQGPPQQPTQGPLWEAINGLEERIDNEGMPLGAIIMWSGDIDTNGNPIIGGTADTNWQICDGSNGTPDLRDRFVVGSGSSYLTGDVGGANSVALTVSEMPGHNHYFSDISSETGGHSHSFSDYTDSAGSHSHGFSGSTNTTGTHQHYIYDRYATGTEGCAGFGFANAADDSWYNNQEWTSQTGSHNHTVSGSTSTWGSHTHYVSGNTGYTGNHTHFVGGNTEDRGGDSAHENRPLYYALAFIMKIQ
jgi:microcystin-dependent protein